MREIACFFVPGILTLQVQTVTIKEEHMNNRSYVW